MDKQFNDFIMKLEGELTRRNRFKIEAIQNFERMKQQLQGMQDLIDTFKNNQGKVLGTIQKFMYMCDIQSSLNIQDEIDREWVSLFSALDDKTGFKATTPVTGGVTEKSQFTLNQDCMSCTGNMIKKLNLFKVACINYEANPVLYQGKLVDRRELISLQKVISELAKEKLDPTRLKESL